MKIALLLLQSRSKRVKSMNVVTKKSVDANIISGKKINTVHGGCKDDETHNAKLTADAISVLNTWKDDNSRKVHGYVTVHQWLRADIEKLDACIREHHLVTVAITRKDIYGITNNGVVFIAERRTLGIGDNFV